MNAKRNKMVRALAAVLAGGSLMGACEARLKDSVIQGSQAFLFSSLAASQGILLCLFTPDDPQCQALLSDANGGD